MEQLIRLVDSFVEKTKQYSDMSFEETQSLTGAVLYAELVQAGRLLGHQINALPREDDRNMLFDRMIQAVLASGLPLGLINVLAEIS